MGRCLQPAQPTSHDTCAAFMHYQNPTWQRLVVRKREDCWFNQHPYHAELGPGSATRSHKRNCKHLQLGSAGNHRGPRREPIHHAWARMQSGKRTKTCVCRCIAPNPRMRQAKPGGVMIHGIKPGFVPHVHANVNVNHVYIGLTCVCIVFIPASTRTLTPPHNRQAQLIHEGYMHHPHHPQHLEGTTVRGGKAEVHAMASG